MFIEYVKFLGDSVEKTVVSVLESVKFVEQTFSRVCAG